MSLVDETDDHPVARIESLELRIAELREAIGRSRRLALAGGVAAVAGPAMLLALLFGFVVDTPARALAALALLIGGIVLMGSSKASTEQLQRQLASVEDERNAAIDALGLVVAGDPEAL